MTSAIKNYWKDVKRINAVLNPDSAKVPMNVRHFFGELPTDWSDNINTLITRPDLVQRAWEAFNARELRTLAGRYHELSNTEPTNGHKPANFETLLEIEGRLDALIDITRTVDTTLTDTLLNARRQIGARIIS